MVLIERKQIPSQFASNTQWILLHFYIVRWDILADGHIYDATWPLYELFLYQTSVYSSKLHFIKDLSLSVVIYSALKGQLLNVETKCFSTLELRMLFFSCFTV